MWNEYCALLLLAWNAWTDLRRREVSFLSLGLFAAGGLLWNLLLPYQRGGELIAGAATGAFVLAAGMATKGAVGLGDGLLLCVTGILLGGTGNLRLLMTGSLLCAAVLGAGLVFGKVRWKQRFPFVPFLCLAQLGRLVWR